MQADCASREKSRRAASAPTPLSPVAPQDLSQESCAKLNGSTVIVLGHVDCVFGVELALSVVRWDGTEHLFRVSRRNLVRMHPDSSIAPEEVPEWRRMPPPPAARAFTWGARPSKLEGVPDEHVIHCTYANELNKSVPIW